MSAAVETTNYEHEVDYFCDHTDPQIVAMSEEFLAEAAANLTEDSTIETEYAKLVYHWVRDNIKYQIQTNWSVPVTKTLERGHGDCGTKSSLLVALLRAGGLDAKYCVEQIETKHWFFFVPSSISSKCNGKSIHFTVSVNVEGNWCRIDPSPDRAIANGMSGVCGDGFRIDFDGKSDCVPDAEDEPQDLPRLDTISNYLVKKSRVPDSVRECFNHSLEHCRNVGQFFSTEQEVADNAEVYMRQHHPEVIADANAFMAGQQERVVVSQQQPLPARAYNTSYKVPPRQAMVSIRGISSLSTGSMIQNTLKIRNLSSHVPASRRIPLVAAGVLALAL